MDGLVPNLWMIQASNRKLAGYLSNTARRPKERWADPEEGVQLAVET